MSRSSVLISLLAVALRLVGPTAAAQSASPGPLEQSAAETVQRVALVDLALRESALPDDYAIAWEIMGVAQQLTPGDTELIRRRIEAAFNAGRPDHVIEGTRELLRIDPRDTVGQLRLIAQRVGRLQTVEERLAAYGRHLGSEGQAIDPAVRSRLALDAALLAGERGDDSLFAEYLTLATELDATNKDAALLAMNYFTDRLTDDRAGRFDLLSNLLYADPLDPNVHRALSDELALVGAFTGARRFQSNAATMFRARSTEDVLSSDLEALALLWQDEGPRLVLTALDNRLAAERSRVRQLLIVRPGALDPDGNPIFVDDVGLDIFQERIRISAADALGEREAVEKAMSEFVQRTPKQIAIFNDPLKRPRGISDEVAAQTTRQVRYAVAEMCLWMNLNLQGVPDEIERLAAEPVPPRVQAQYGPGIVPTDLLRAWLRFREGDLAVAEPVLRASAHASPFAVVGLGLLLEEQGKKNDAARLYRAAAIKWPAEPGAAWSHSRWIGITGGGPLTGWTERLEAAAAAIPRWADDMIRDPRSYMALRFEADPNSSAGESATIRITLRNVGAIPLGVGSARAMNTRFLTSLSLEPGDPPILMEQAPMVFDLDRRLRLMPGESINAVIHPGAALAGLQLEALADRNVRMRWRAVQGFMPAIQGPLMPGPGCLNVETASIVRSASPDAKGPVDDLIALWAQAAETSLDQAIVGLWGRSSPMAAKPATESERAALGAAVAARYASSSPTARALIVAGVPPTSLVPAMRALDNACASESDPMVLAIVLAARVSDPADPRFESARSSSDERLARLAGLLSARLALPGRSYTRDEGELARRLGGLKPAPVPEPAP